MEETAVVSMEFVLVALIALAVSLGIVWYGVTSRTREFDRRITKLEEENAKLRGLLDEACQSYKKQTAAAPQQTAGEPAPAKPVVSAAPVQHPVVPVGTRHPVVVPARPMTIVPKTEQTAGAAPPEIVAVIMAAVAACGYSPAAIRSIRPLQRRSQNWIMAGRLANMK